MQSTGSTDRKEGATNEGTDRVGKPISKDEVSGLHEIKALAAKTVEKQRVRRSTEQPAQAEAEAMMAAPAASGQVILAQPGREAKIALPAMVAPDVAVAQPVAPPARTGSRAALFAVLAVVLAGAGVAAFMFTRGGSKAPEAPPVVAQAAPPPAAPPPVAVAPAPVAQPMPAEQHDEEKPADSAETQVAPNPVDKADKTVAGNPADHAVQGVAKDHGAAKADPMASKTPAPDKAASKAVEAATKEAAPAPAEKKGGDDELGNLLDGQSDSKKAVDDGPALPAQLDAGQIKTGMSAVRGDAQACYAKFQQKGLVKIRAKIDPSGSVSSAEATGEFAGTPTGACVAAAVKGAHFPKVSGQPLTVSYPFMLSEE